MLVEHRDTGAGAARRRTVGDGKDARVGRIALPGELREGLLLYAVGGDGADFRQHILPRVEDSGAAAERRFAIAENIVG